MSAKKPPGYLGAVGERWLGSDGYGYFRPGKISLPEKVSEQEKQRWCLMALGDPRLPRQVRNAILKYLEVPPRRYNMSNRALQAWIAQQCIRARKAEMEARGERPQGGRYDAAVADIAGMAGITPGGVRQRIRRSRKSKRKD